MVVRTQEGTGYRGICNPSECWFSRSSHTTFIHFLLTFVKKTFQSPNLVNVPKSRRALGATKSAAPTPTAVVTKSVAETTADRPAWVQLAITKFQLVNRTLSHRRYLLVLRHREFSHPHRPMYPDKRVVTSRWPALLLVFQHPRSSGERMLKLWVVRLKFSFFQYFWMSFFILDRRQWEQAKNT